MCMHLKKPGRTAFHGLLCPSGIGPRAAAEVFVRSDDEPDDADDFPRHPRRNLGRAPNILKI